MLELFAKLQAEKYLFEKIFSVAQQRFSSYLPAEITNLWHQVNSTELHLITLPCYDKIISFINSSNFQLITQIVTNISMQLENGTISGCSEGRFENFQHFEETSWTNDDTTELVE